MATRLKKLMTPILKQKCTEAFKAGFEKGKAAGWEKRILAYENQIKCLRTQLDWTIQKIKELAEENTDLRTRKHR